MENLQAQIDKLFNQLKTLLEQIAALRLGVEKLEKDLSFVQREYERMVGPYNIEADRLEALRATLRARLEEPQSLIPSPHQQVTQKEEQPSSAPILYSPVSFLTAPETLPAPQPTDDPQSKRKRILADHIDYFVAPGDRETVMQVVNAVLEDERRDIGDMLELLSWGEIWTSCAAWETPSEQYERLQTWESTLKERLEHWKTRLAYLNDDPRRGLLREMNSRKPPEWSAYLDELTENQKEYNKKLRNEIDILENELAKNMIKEI